MERKRVVVTGMGIVSCLGHSPETFHQNLLAGVSGIRLLEDFDPEAFPIRIGGGIQDFELGEYMDRKQGRRADKYIRYAMVAGKKALEDANLSSEEREKLDLSRCGVLVGSGMGGMDTFHDGVKAYLNRGPRKLSPFFVPYIITNMGGAMLAMDLGFMGPNYSISTACATANYCFFNAANHIRSGHADLMVCGGVEATISPVGVAGFIACRALSKRNDEPERASRPWDKHRDGFVIGEGAGILILESLEHAQARGARIYAELKGGGISCDAFHMTEPRDDGKGIADCIRYTLEDAQVAPDLVRYVNAHATSTPAGDMAEVRAILQVLQDPSKVAIHSTKSMIGHALGAAGGVEAIATIKALESGWVHPTLNLEDPEEEITRFQVPTKAEKLDPSLGLSLSFGFGGHNAAILFEKWRGEVL